MQVCWRRTPSGQIDHELLWLSISMGTLALAGGWLTLGLPWPGCIFLTLTGHPCLTCGATRAAIQFLHGNFTAALWWNPLAFAFLCALSVFDTYAAIVLIMRAPRLRVAALSQVEKNLVRTLVVSLLALNWMYLLAHSSRYI
jgi:hypothetical protein